MTSGRTGTRARLGGLAATAAVALVLLAVAPALACSPGALVTVNPKEAAPGTPLQVDGQLFREGAGPVDIFWVGATATTKVATAYPTAGRFTRQIWVPVGAAPGSYSVMARQLDADRRGYLGAVSAEMQVVGEAPATTVTTAAPEPAAADPAPAPEVTTPSGAAATSPAPSATSPGVESVPAQPALSPAEGRQPAAATAEPAAAATAGAAAAAARSDDTTTGTVAVAEGADAAPVEEPAPAAVVAGGEGMPPVAGATRPLVVSDPSAFGRPPTVGGTSSGTLLFLGVVGLAVFAAGTGIVANDLRRRRALATDKV